MICINKDCGNKNAYLIYDDGTCNKCHDHAKPFKKPKPKKKMGRPVTKTPEQKASKHKQWFIDNADRRRDYQREYQRKRMARNKLGTFVCQVCGETFEKKAGNQKRCLPCSKAHGNDKRREEMRMKKQNKGMI